MNPTLAATLTDNSLLYYINTVLPYSCHIVQTVASKSVTLTKKLKAQLKYKHSILKTKKKNIYICVILLIGPECPLYFMVLLFLCYISE